MVISATRAIRRDENIVQLTDGPVGGLGAVARRFAAAEKPRDASRHHVSAELHAREIDGDGAAVALGERSARCPHP